MSRPSSSLTTLQLLNLSLPEPKIKVDSFRTVAITMDSSTNYVVPPSYLVLEESASFRTSLDFKTIEEFNKDFLQVVEDITGMDIGKLFAGQNGRSSAIGSLFKAIDFFLQSSGYIPKIKNIQTFRIPIAQRPISVSLRFEFAFGKFGLWDALYEVYLPIFRVVRAFTAWRTANEGLFLPSRSYANFVVDQLVGLFESSLDIVTNLGTFVAGFLPAQYTEEEQQQLNRANNLNDDDRRREEERRRVESAREQRLREEYDSARRQFQTRENIERLYDTGIRAAKGQSRNRQVWVRIGNLLRLEDCTVDDIDWNFSPQFTADGFPIHGTLSLSLTSRGAFFSTMMPTTVSVPRNSPRLSSLEKE